jgi:predicted O-methyltransferase YrrM
MYGYYRQKMELAKKYASKAKLIVEIGVRAGYSAHAFLSAIDNPQRYVGYDLFTPYMGWDRGKENVEMILHRDFPNISISLVQADTTKMSSIDLHEVDLFHVDGDHSFNGCYMDMNIAWPTIAIKGVMIVDDYDHIPEVKSAVDKFIEANDKMSCVYEKTYRGDMVMVKE